MTQGRQGATLRGRRRWLARFASGLATGMAATAGWLPGLGWAQVSSARAGSAAASRPAGVPSPSAGGAAAHAASDAAARARASRSLSLANAVGYPRRVVTLWVPWQAGGATDMQLRVLADAASRVLGERIIVDNRAGAGGTLVMPILQAAAPDGYTVGQVPQPVLRQPFVNKVAWDPLRDLTPIIQVSGVTFGVIVPASGAFQSLQDLFAYAKAHPGELSIATNGVGTTPHAVLEQLFTARGFPYIHVPYKGVGEQINAVASGQVMAGVGSTGFAPAVDAGTIRLLATLGARRTRRWPTVPTLTELGHPIVEMSPWGIAGPRGMPPEIVAALHDAFHEAMRMPEFLAEIARYDQEIDYLGPADYARALRTQSARERANAERLGLLRAP